MSTQPPDLHGHAGRDASIPDKGELPAAPTDLQPPHGGAAPSTSQPPDGLDLPGEIPADEMPNAVPRNRREIIVGELGYWSRTAALGAIAGALYALTRWDQARIPTSRRLTVDSRLAPAGDAAQASIAPALVQALRQVQVGLRRGDSQAVAVLALAEGVRVAPYRGAPPISQGQTTDAARLLKGILTDSRPRVLGWREENDALVVVLTTGWSAQHLPLESSPALRATDLMAFWLVALEQRWRWRALTPDHDGELTRLARSVVWRPVPNG